MISEKKNSITEKRILIITSVPYPYGTSANSNFLTNFTVGVSKYNHKFKLLIQKQSKKNNSIFEGIMYQGCGTFGISSKFLSKPLSKLADIILPPLYLIKNRKKNR